jgi:hypothetical protein
MPTSVSYCEECGKSYFLRDEMYIPFKNYRFRFKDISKPVTWEDWLVHVSSHCDECRLKEIPDSCWINYLKLKGG